MPLLPQLFCILHSRIIIETLKYSWQQKGKPRSLTFYWGSWMLHYETGRLGPLFIPPPPSSFPPLAFHIPLQEVAIPKHSSLCCFPSNLNWKHTAQAARYLAMHAGNEWLLCYTANDSSPPTSQLPESPKGGNRFCALVLQPGNLNLCSGRVSTVPSPCSELW